MKQLKFSSKSVKDIIVISEYIEAKFSLKNKENFLDRLKENFDLIENNPNLFQKSENKKLYKCVVTRFTTIFYEIRKNEVYIVRVFDTRQKPIKIR